MLNMHRDNVSYNKGIPPIQSLQYKTNLINRIWKDARFYFHIEKRRIKRNIFSRKRISHLRFISLIKYFFLAISFFKIAFTRYSFWNWEIFCFSLLAYSLSSFFCNFLFCYTVSRISSSLLSSTLASSLVEVCLVFHVTQIAVGIGSTRASIEHDSKYQQWASYCNSPLVA